MLSHYLVLKEFLENENSDSSFILVAEDNAMFDKNLFQIVENIAKNLKDGDVGILGLAHADEPGVYDFFGSDENLVQLSLLSAVVGKGRNRRYRFGKPVGLVMGTGLYIMTRPAALNYLNYIQRVGNVHWASDQWGYFEKSASLNIKVLQPSACGFREISSIRDVPPSSIGNGNSGKKRGIRGESLGTLQDLRSSIALRTRVRRAKGVISATFFDLSEKIK